MILTGTIVWPKLFKAEKFDERDAQAKFSCTLLIPKDDPQAKTVKEAVASLIASKLGGEAPEERYMPVKDGDKSNNPDFEGCWEIRCKANEDNRPNVVDQSLDPILDPAAIRGGDQVRLDVNIYAYSRKFRGIGVQVNNVQFVCKGDKPIGAAARRAEDVFQKIDGSTATKNKDAAGFLA